MVLREHGALETIRALFNTQSVNRADADTLVERVAAGPVEPADSPILGFAVLSEKLAAGSIQADLVRDRVQFGMSDSLGVELTQPIQHPWFPLQRVQSIGKNGASAEFEALEEANNRWGRMLETGAPEALVEKARAQLEARVKVYFEQLVSPEDLHFNERILFSGRSVIAAGYEYRYDQVGVPEEMAWALFGPLAAREIGMKAVEKRDGKAAKALDEAMAGSWVVAYRAPAYTPRPFLAFRPVRCEGNAIRLSGAACKMMNADFDGDQVALFLPLTEGAQKEAEQCLTIAAHLNTSSELLHHVLPKHDALFGLASLSLTDDGLQEIVSAAGIDIERNWQFLSDRILETTLRPVLNQEGAEVTLEACDRLTRLGYDAAQREGASMNPFLGSTCDLPSAPEDDDLDQWRAFKDEMMAWLSDYGSVEDNDLGPIFLLFESGARANQNQVVQYLAGGLLIDAEGKVVIQHQGWQKGLTPKELFTRVVGARKGLVNMMSEVLELNQDLETRTAPPGHHVLARARRARQPGVVFARAASNKEHDPLTDLHSRLFVGLPAG